MKIDFANLQYQYQLYKDDIDEAIHAVLDKSNYIMGEEVSKLEENLQKFTGAKYAITCSSGTDALLLAMMALGIKPDDEIITTPFTFIATAETISFLGAKPVFVDIDEESYNIDASKIKNVITNKTKAIMPVSLYGQCADMDAINEIAKEFDIPVIEDACQSFGATYNDKKSCNLSTIGCTSFFPSKPLGAYGDGGAVFTDDDEIATKIRMLLNHGQNERYKHKYIGINGRLDAVQAAVLNVKLKHFDKEVKLRDEIGERYSDLLEEANVITPKIHESNKSVYAQYSIRVEDRESMVEKLTALEIPTAVHYPVPLHLQEAFKDLGYSEGDFPISEKISSQIMSLPMSPYLTEAEQDFIVQAIKG